MHLVWFKNDLRVADNNALFEACKNADGVMGVFLIPYKTWQLHDRSAVQVDLILRQLKDLSDSLGKINIPLKIMACDAFKDIPNLLLKLCQKHSVTDLFTEKDFLVDEAKRDELTEKALLSVGTQCHFIEDRNILMPTRVVKNDGMPFKVFTPFKKRWLAEIKPMDYALKPVPNKQKDTGIKSDSVPDKIAGFDNKSDAKLWPASEAYAAKLLKTFCQDKIADYQLNRDFPNLPGTSKISAYLAVGIVSLRQCLHAAMRGMGVKKPHDLLSDAGAQTWLSELIWREFYTCIAYHFPMVMKHQPFQAYTDNLPWDTSPEKFQAWCDGQTGFPIVDAAMRCLKQTGWMHNRLRMVVAMFFTKTLFLDWRMGEQYFMQQLVDGDFCSNNGGWQWSASTGTDAAPYFRIFNPTSQSEKFDKRGDFIRQWVPELKAFSDKEIHNPSPIFRDSVDYPMPIVDYKLMRSQVIEAFKSLKK